MYEPSQQGWQQYSQTYGASSMFQVGVAEKPEIERMVDRIDEESRQLIDVVDDLLSRLMPVSAMGGTPAEVSIKQAVEEPSRALTQLGGQLESLAHRIVEIRSRLVDTISCLGI